MTAHNTASLSGRENSSNVWRFSSAASNRFASQWARVAFVRYRFTAGRTWRVSGKFLEAFDALKLLDLVLQGSGIGIGEGGSGHNRMAQIASDGDGKVSLGQAIRVA